MAALTRPAVLARAAGLLVLGALLLAILGRGLRAPFGGGVLGFIHMIDLVFHEAGHVIFGVFGRFLAVLGGSLNQVLIPAVCTGYFLRQAQHAAAAVTLFWTGESVVDVAIYVADGRDTKLPLLADGLTHDWNWILSALSLRDQAEPIGRVVFLAGVFVMLAALVLLALDLRRAASTRAPEGVLSSSASDRKIP
ncbi:MAG TPA: hypothetical protein VFW70_13960 [Methylomirabilota bacterium]|nr:hypothetical protein [Methylomirabilota bacterium]